MKYPKIKKKGNAYYYCKSIGNSQKITDCTIKIVEETKIESKDNDYSIKYKLLVTTKTMDKIIIDGINPTDFSNFKRFENQCGMAARLLIPNYNDRAIKKLLASYILDHSRPIKTTIFNSLGFRKYCNKDYFLFADCAILSSGMDINHKVDTGGNMSHYSINNEFSRNNFGNINLIKKPLNLLKLFKKNPFKSFAILSSFSSVLFSILSPTRVTFLIVGDTTYGKSTLATLIMKFYGRDFTSTQCVAAFSDTYSVLKLKAQACNNLPMLVDDFVIEEGGNELLDKASKLIRAVGNNHAGEISDMGKSIITNQPLNVLPIMTAQSIPTLEESAQFRCIILPLEKQEFSGHENLLAKGSRGELACATATLIQYILKNKLSLTKAFQSLRNKYLAEISSSSYEEVNSHVKNNIVNLMASNHLFFKTLYTEKLLTKSQYLKLKKQSSNHLVTLMLEQMFLRKNHSVSAHQPAFDKFFISIQTAIRKDILMSEKINDSKGYWRLTLSSNNSDFGYYDPATKNLMVCSKVKISDFFIQTRTGQKNPQHIEIKKLMKQIRNEGFLSGEKQKLTMRRRVREGQSPIPVYVINIHIKELE